MTTRVSTLVRCQPGFTLLELIGVLAILAMLTWIATDGVLARAKESHRQYEAARLAEIGSALSRGILRQQLIPAETNWPTLAAGELAEPETRVVRNEIGWNRRLIYDPNFRVGLPLARPPYVQNTSGSLAPVAPRAVLLSTVAADFPSLTSVRFEDLWECPANRLPQGWSTRWAGRPEDLFIERLNWESHLHRVCLNNLNLDSPARFALGETNFTGTVAAQGRWDAYLFADTQFWLLGPDGSAQYVEIVTGPVSFAFEGERWRRNLESGLGSSLGPMATSFDQFRQSAVGPTGVTPNEVARAMHDLLGEYVNWAGNGFVHVTPLLGTPAPPFRRLTEVQAQLSDFAGQLLGETIP